MDRNHFHPERDRPQNTEQHPDAEPCPVCGSPSCEKETAYVENFRVHKDDHPERQVETAMDNRRAW